MKNLKQISTLLLLCVLIFACSDRSQTAEASEQIRQLSDERDSLKGIVTANPNETNGQLYTFLTFQKEDAEQAMNFYISLFDNSSIVDLKRWGQGAPGKEGTIMQATFTLNGKLFMCSDSPPIHDWDFSPAVSTFVECTDESELKRLFDRLSENGKVMMPLNNYGFSQQFGYVQDQFGVFWQLNLQ